MKPSRQLQVTLPATSVQFAFGPQLAAQVELWLVAQRKPRSWLRSAGSIELRLVGANSSAGSVQLPPRKPRAVPLPCAQSLHTEGKTNVASKTHSAIEPARSK